MQPSKVIRQKRGHGTYDDIVRWVKARYGFKPDLSWIAHCKEMAGLAVHSPYSWYRPHARQCPIEKQMIIFQALKAFAVIPGSFAEKPSHRLALSQMGQQKS